jgi:chorismate--pyruvate lyase
MTRQAGHAHWFAHVNGINPDRALRAWLTDAASLTLKLMSCGSAFRVRCLHQRTGICLADEMEMLQLRRRHRVTEREVLLHCDGRPVVFAHTVLPLSASASDWPGFAGLGERPLGAILFGDPRVGRGALQYARLPMRHPLVRRANDALDAGGPDAIRHPPYARRRLYRRNNGAMLVTEIFLPALLEHMAAGANTGTNNSNRQSDTTADAGE